MRVPGCEKDGVTRMDKVPSAQTQYHPFFKLHLTDVAATDGNEEQSVNVSSFRSAAYINSPDVPDTGLAFLCNPHQDNAIDFCEWYDEQHQTLTKHVAGAPHQEKIDHSKPCKEPALNSDDSGERGPGPSSLPSTTDMLHYARICSATGVECKTTEKTAESVGLPADARKPVVSGKAQLKENIFHSDENDCSQSIKSQKNDESFISFEHKKCGSISKPAKTDHPFEAKNKGKLLLGNKIMENLNLAIQELMAHGFREHAKDMIKCFVSCCLEIGLITTAHQLSGDLAGMDDSLQALMKSLHPHEEKELETEKHEHEEQEKMSWFHNPLNVTWPKRQPFVRSVAMELAQNLSQHNCLTNETLVSIYKYYKEQTMISLQSPVFNPARNFQDSIESLSKHSETVKLSLSDSMFPMTCLESETAKVGVQLHMSEVLIEDALHLQPVENSFYFPTSVGLLSTTPIVRAESLHLVPRIESVKALLLSLIYTFQFSCFDKSGDNQTGLSHKQPGMHCTEAENNTGRGERELEKEKEDAADFLEKAETAEVEKELSSSQEGRCRENKIQDSAVFVKKSEIKDMETKAESSFDMVDDTEVLEKSDFEESEKAGAATDPVNSFEIKEFGSYTEGGRFEKEDSGASDRQRRRKTSKKHGKRDQHSQLFKQKNKTNEMTSGNHSSKMKSILKKENMILEQLLPVMCQTKQSPPVANKRVQGTTNLSVQSSANGDENSPCLQTGKHVARAVYELDFKKTQQDLLEAQGSLFQHEAYTEHDLPALLDENANGMRKNRLTNQAQVIIALYHTTNKKLQKRRCANMKKSSHSRSEKAVVPDVTIGLLKQKQREDPSYAKQNCCQGKSLMQGPLEGAPKTRDEMSHLPKPERIDVQGAVAVVMTTSDSQQSQSGGNVQEDNQGGASNGHNRGGARPKLGRSNGGSGSRQDKDGDDDDDDKRPPRRVVPESLPLAPVVTPVDNPRKQGGMPIRNYKRHRQKHHGVITNEQMCYCLGQAGLGIHVLRQWCGVEELDACLMLCLHDIRNVTSPSSDFLSCCACAILHSLLTHFTQSAHSIEECSVCSQLATLVHYHIEGCHSERRDEEEEEDLSQNICYKMRKAGQFSSDIETISSTKAYIKLRKYLSAALGPVFLLDIDLEGSKEEGLLNGQNQDSKPCTTDKAVEDLQHVPSFATSFEQLPSQNLERHVKSGTVFPVAGTAMPLSDVSDCSSVTNANPVMLRSPQGGPQRRRPSSRVVPQQTIPEEPSSPEGCVTPPAPNFTEEPSLVEFALFPPRAPETSDEQEDIMDYIRRYKVKEKETVVKRQVAEDPSARVYGPDGTVSMPEPRSRHILADQYLSVEMQPTGVPGIGEVVYGTRQHLMLVAKNWLQERDECKATRKCRYQHREEGVILHAFKEQLRILHTRYQKHQQWERLVHLGNGVTGKCHLCIDRTSNFKFCCKKMHILQYEDQELEIWSELSHPNLVCFYGAIRHGEKIYLFAEFIDGGSLAALIKQQWVIGRRLSHWTALNYFRQLLHVLTYLQSVGILHEDIKADNVLVRNGTTEIVLADFGAAQRIPNDHTPPNRHPTGSPAHWSPEKAASEGHGFPSDLWASACVLIHMLSGSPPWISRYPDAAILNFIIWSKPPPMDDVPDNVKESVRDLIKCCLEKDKALRPTAKQILGHPAFQLLDQSGSFFSTFTHPVSTVADPVVTVVTCHQLNPTFYHAHQAASKTETSTCSKSVYSSQLSLAGTTQMQVSPSPVTIQAQQSMSSTVPLDLIRSEVKVIETGHDCLSSANVIPSGLSCEPQSLPASFHAGEPPCTEPFEHNSKSHSKRFVVQCKSAPPASAPFSTKRSSEQNSTLGEKQEFVMISTSSILSDLTVLKKSEKTWNSSVQEFSGSTCVSSPPVSGTSVMKAASSSSLPGQQEMGDKCNLTASHSSSSLLGSAPKSKGLLFHSKSADMLMLEPLPDMPSPVLAGPNSLPEGKSDNIFQATSVGMLQIPLPNTFSPGDSGRKAMPTSFVGYAEDPSDLSPYGASSASTVLRTGLSSAVNISPRIEEAQTVASQSGHFATLSTSISCGAVGNQSDTTVGRISFMKTEAPGLTIPSPDSPCPHVIHTLCCASDKLASSRSSPQTVSLYQEYNDRQDASHLPTMLPLISEAEECSSFCTAQITSSAESVDDTMLNYIQDQFLADTSGHLDSFWAGQAGNRPRLKPYLAPPTLTNITDELFMQENWSSHEIPKFEQLLQSLADSSATLRSRRNISSGEMTSLHSHCQSASSVPASNCVTGFISQGCTPSGQQLNKDIHNNTILKSTSCSSPLDEPDQALSRHCASLTLPISADHLIQENIDEDRISSGDIFGSGPNNNSGVLEAFKYSQSQKGFHCEQQQHFLNSDRCSPVYQHEQPTLSSSAPTHPAEMRGSPRSLRKNPNLRLTVKSPTQHSEQPSVGNKQNECVQAPRVSSQNQALGIDDILPLSTGVSPLTASPLLNEVKLNDAGPRSRNGSGSSVSTPKSSTYDIQEQAWTTFQLPEQGFDTLLTEDHTEVPGSQNCRVFAHITSISQEHGKESFVDYEESSMLSILQEEINEDKIGGHRLVFTDPAGVKLFDMRVLGQNKFWKELAATFRGQIDKKAGFTHYTLTQPDGQTPVDFLSAYDPSISHVKVMELSEELENIASVCWCVKHLVY